MFSNVSCLEVNLDTKMGKIYHAKLFLKDQNFHITGQEAEKLGENSYRVREGSLTTCDAIQPLWRFNVKELEVTVNGSGIAKGSLFYLEEIPFLYLPIAIFPVNRERQTGFLMPRFGYSKEEGPELKTAFFWAITKDMDATLYLDYLGQRGFKEGLEYRYALTPDTRGQANLYFSDDQIYGQKRYAFFSNQQQKLPYDFYLKGNINYVSDHQYVRDFDEDLPEGAKIDSRSRGQLRLTLFGGKNWDQFSFLSEASVFDNLTQESNKETVQKLPQISFHAHPQPLFKTPLFYDVAASYTNFWRREGVRFLRGDFFPRISYPLRLFNVLKMESDVGVRETVYQPYNDPTGQFKEWKSREILEAGMEMSTEFYRVYEGAMVSKVSKLYNVAKWMHTIEPTIGYRYTPRVNQKDIPEFDDLDRIPYTNQITYGVTQRLIGKPEKVGASAGPREYAKLNLFQSYSLGDPFQTDSKGKKRNFSNIQGEFWWNFSPYLSISSDGELNPYRGTFDVWNAAVGMRDNRKDLLQIQYRFTRDSIQEINLDTRIKTIPPLYLFGSVRYDLLNKWRVERHLWNRI